MGGVGADSEAGKAVGRVEMVYLRRDFPRHGCFGVGEAGEGEGRFRHE